MPIATGVIAVLTLSTIQIVAHTSGEIPSWFHFTPFSIAATGYTQQYIYAIGMVFASICALITAYLVDHLGHTFAPSYEGWIKANRVFAACMSLGLTLQAVLPLQKDFASQLGQRVHNKIDYSTSSILHLVFAGLFFLSATVYCLIWTYVVFKSEGYQRICVPCSRWIKYISITLVILSVITSFLIHPATQITPRGNSRDYYNAGGFLQWVCVGSLIVYLTTFSMDLSEANKLEAVPIEEQEIVKLVNSNSDTETL